ncbi:MAG: 4'-phosphopantetheinyl transferase superfamily protein [Spirosomataceae bacterium]
MPIVRRWSVFDTCAILIWEIAEPKEELQRGLIIHPEEWEEYHSISHPQKQLEWLSGRRAMQSLIESKGGKYEGMVKDEYGKPHLKNKIAEISLTHTWHYIAVAMHPDTPIGIDLERIAEKLARVAPKFLSEPESQYAAHNLKRLCTYWCGKEALYKLHGTRQLSFRDNIFVDNFSDDDHFLTGSIQQLPPAFRQNHQLHRFEIEDFLGVVAV